eukprot:2686968-Alexandrium_andersonii.AAC.1
MACRFGGRRATAALLGAPTASRRAKMSDLWPLVPRRDPHGLCPDRLSASTPLAQLFGHLSQLCST